MIKPKNMATKSRVTKKQNNKMKNSCSVIKCKNNKIKMVIVQ